MPLNVWQRSAVDQQGNIMPFADVEVRDEVTSNLVQVYADYEGATALGNPFEADSTGFIQFYAEPGRYQITVSSGAFTRVWDNVSLGMDSADIEYRRTTAEIDAGVTPVNKYIHPYPIDPLRYYDADQVSAINDAILVAQSTLYPHFMMTGPPTGTAWQLGNTTFMFDFSDHAVIELKGLMHGTRSAGTQVIIGSTLHSVYYQRVYVAGVQRTSIDSAGSSVGIQLLNTVWSVIDIRRCKNYFDNVLPHGSLGSPTNDGGCSYNTVFLGQIHDGRNNLHLTATGANGYCNENTFIGGSYSHTSSWPAVASMNLQIDHNASHRLNNNAFIKPSFEDGSALAVAANISGDYNMILWPRMENPVIATTYEIQLTVNSQECHIIPGAQMVKTNINDAGTNNIWATRDTKRYKNRALAGEAVQTSQSNLSDLAHTYESCDTGGVARAWMLGNGGGLFGAALRRRRITITYSASMTIDSSLGDMFSISPSNATAFTLNAPTNPIDGHQITLTIYNAAGVALGVITWNAVFKMSTWTSPAAGFNRSITFEYDGTSWVQVSQTGVDVPN